MKTQEPPSKLLTKPIVNKYRALADGGDEKWMETIRLLAEGGRDSKDWFNHLLAQYSWDAYVNELEFE
jgi:hypothetical protein